MLLIMKKLKEIMKKLLLFILIITSLLSCETEDDAKFYTFSNNDYKFIPTIYENNEDEILIFKNQYNEEVKIQIKSFRFNKKSHGGISFTQDYSEFYYTEQIIIWIDLIEVTLTVDNGNIDDYCDDFHIIIEKKSDGTTETKLKIPSYVDTSFGGSCSGSRLISNSPYNNLNEMSINNKVYTKIKVFETDNNFYFFNNSTINKLYFDFKNGLVGFDDTLNNINYRIVN